MPKVLIPSQSAEDWKRFLADESQWRTGYSARSLANCWHDAAGFPAEVAAILKTEPAFASLEPLVAIPEHKVALPDGGRPSQTDVWVLARTDTSLVSIAVEGKVSETFGPTISEWLVDASPGKRVRLAALRELLGIEDEPPEDIRYQLLHRTASAIIEARRFHAAHAVMLVHSFSQDDIWFDDFARFVSFLGASAERGRLVVAPRADGPTLHMGWVRGDPRYLTM